MSGLITLAFLLAAFLLIARSYVMGRRKFEAAHQRVQETSDLHLATLEALARAIDAKDQTAEMHIRRVQLFAAGLAEAVGLSAADVQGVRTAALLHDIGNLAVPEHILSKPGPLTPEEFQKIRIHSQVGADILANVPFPYPVAPLILSHHERWDGQGYPSEVAGEQIPIGARILAVVDYYDTVTTDRPYHKALSREPAIALLRYEAGRALDPILVEKFIGLLPTLTAQVAAAALDRRDGSGVPSQPPASAALMPSTEQQSVFENIALAHREIYALYEIAQSMGTSLGVSETMALISSKVANIVPWSSCALFLYDDSSDSMTCRYAAGVDATRMLHRTVKTGAGLSGWVARNRRTLVRTAPRGTDGDLVPGTGLKSAVVCPLLFNDRFIGTLALYHREANRYTEDHRRLLEQVAEQAGAVIHNSLVFKQTQEDSLTDPLTGLLNRRSMFLNLSREFARAKRFHGQVALIVLDIDEFKVINDTYGHDIGDRALQKVAEVLHVALRPYDICVRYGGDEFIVIMSDCSRESAEAKRYELQQRIGEIQLEVRPGMFLRLGVSAGTSVFPHDGQTGEALLADADHRMYRDKAARRGGLNVAPAAAPVAPLGSPESAHQPSPPPVRLPTVPSA